ncbi:sugar transferase [Maribacter sp. 2-571]|uniref:sugar transferase n=1 Tax=Maribacter sp. 2-571 TaxID=3417569 RepID=UPI003D34A9AB
MYTKVVKPLLDFFVALLALSLLSPIVITVTLILLYSNNGKPFFFQLRPGKNEKIFKIIKFKTMNDRKDPDGNLLPDFERMTTIGKWIRNSSLDELPQLLNVLKGDMSIVGPRPLLVAYLTRYNREQAQRHLVKPGITGWAQVNGRNAISWEEKFAHDIWYVKNIGFVTDFRILLKTVHKVFISEGVSANETVTMEMFMGTERKIDSPD